jgi:hypothetical protein
LKKSSAEFGFDIENGAAIEVESWRAGELGAVYRTARERERLFY